jgi:hypothetical protein
MMNMFSNGIDLFIEDKKILKGESRWINGNVQRAVTSMTRRKAILTVGQHRGQLLRICQMTGPVPNAV